MEKKPTTHLVQGLLIALIIILISIVAYVMGQDQSSWQKWVGDIVLIGGVIASCIVYSNQRNNNVTFGNTFAHGFKVSAVVTCLVIIFSVIFIMFIPDVKDKAIEIARQQMIAKGTDQATIDKSMEITQKFFYAFVIGVILFVYLFLGLIAALIGAGVAKKNPQSPFDQQQMV